MREKAILFEDREARAFLNISIAFILLLIVNSVLYYYNKLNEIFIHISLMVVYIFTALVILYQAFYTKRMVIESRKVQAWQIISGHLYNHIAAAIIAFKLVARNLSEVLTREYVEWSNIKKLFKSSFTTNNAPYIIQPYIRPRPGIGAGKGTEIYSATIPSFKEALEILIKACTVLSEKGLEKELRELHKQIDEILMLLYKEPMPKNLRDRLNLLKTKIESLSKKAESIFHIPVTEPLLEDFHPNLI